MIREPLTSPEDNQPRLTQYGIPIRNIWLLVLYASEFYRAGYLQSVGHESVGDDTSELIAEILCRQVEQRLRDSLTQTYVSRTEALTRVRGRVELLRTEQQQLLRQGKVMCTFETLTLNTPRNCFVRGALEHLSNLLTHKSLAKRCIQLSKQMRLRGVIGNAPSLRQVWKERFGRHDKADKVMFFAAKLAYQLRIPTELKGSYQFHNPTRDEQRLRHLFEKAVAGFFNVRLSETNWQVHAGKQLSWQIDDRSPGADSIFPGMKTDIVLENQQEWRRIIIDTKFNSLLRPGYHRAETLRSGYLYQLYTYLRSQEQNEDPLSINSEGVLLHPSTGVDIDEFVVIQGHRMRFITVDLGAESNIITEQLTSLLA